MFKAFIVSVALAFALGATATVTQAAPPLIGGKIVKQSDYPAIVWIGWCTASIVGPRTVITAGHCFDGDGKAEFTLNGTTYKLQLTQSPHYDDHSEYDSNLDGKDSDLSLGVTSQVIQGVKPISVGGTPVVGKVLTLFGYGCSQPDESGDDTKLRSGKNSVAEVRENGMLLKGFLKGASGCPGDSGGPAIARLADGTLTILGIASQVGFQDNGLRKPETYEARMDTVLAQDFLSTFSKAHNVDICGFNSTCL